MMQQVAALKLKDAASTIPFKNPVERGGKEAFSNALNQEPQRLSAFEQAQQNANNSSVSNKQSASSQNRQSHENINSASNTTQQVRETRQRRDDSSVNESPRNRADNEVSQNSKALEKADNASGEIRESEVAKAQAKQQEQAIQDKNNAAEDTPENSANIKSETDKSEAPIEVSAKETQGDDFDYVSFVNQLAEYTGNGTELDKALLDVNVDQASTNSDMLTLEIPIAGDQNGSGIENIDNDFLTVSISKQELQMILDAQNAKVDLNAKALSEQDLEKLQDIIAAMLSQLNQEGSEQTIDTNTQKLADQALLAALLLNQNNASGQSSKENNAQLLAKEVSSQLATKNDKAEGVISPSANDEQIQESLKAKVSGEPQATTTNKLMLDEWAKTPDTTLKAPNADLGSKTPDNNLKKDAIIKTPLQNLIGLDDAQAQEAIKNLKERVQSVVSDLSASNKGNEFVAALQSGVKEFKQQLANGREPGLDLKALISEALASTNTEVSNVQQPKIDSAVNQFNAVLNLANMVNYSATQQQAQVVGLTDNQFAKEMNVLQTEGTKLANAANSQLNGQTNLDKAVNIFKAEGQQQLAEKVRWMVNSRNPSAEIRLDPPDLGGMQIKVNLSGDTAQVNFNVQSPAAKEALDQAVPRLREMLAQQGIELGQSSVQQDSQGQQSGQQDGELNEGNASALAGGFAEEATEETTNTVLQQRVTNGALGGIDYYA